MGRKIPGRKHRGVKDPIKQQQQRFNSIKDKINTPPSNPDEQQIPKSVLRIMELKNKVKEGYFDKRKRKSDCDDDNTNRKNSRIVSDPRFKQLPNETDRQFLYRINKICDEVKKEAAFENKYGVEIKRNEMGEIEKVVKRPKDVLELMIKKAKRDKKANKKDKKNAQVENEEIKLTKSQKWQLKKKEKRLKKLKGSSQIEQELNRREQIKFGDIAHAPPQLVVPKKSKKDNKEAPRPGKKDLLLKSVVNSKTGEINKCGKRKDMPVGVRRQLEKQQQEVMQAYKNLKKIRNSNT